MLRLRSTEKREAESLQKPQGSSRQRVGHTRKEQGQPRAPAGLGGHGKREGRVSGSSTKPCGDQG
jgi:hypothetical protein